MFDSQWYTRKGDPRVIIMKLINIIKNDSSIIHYLSQINGNTLDLSQKGEKGKWSYSYIQIK